MIKVLQGMVVMAMNNLTDFLYDVFVIITNYYEAGGVKDDTSNRKFRIDCLR